MHQTRTTAEHQRATDRLVPASRSLLLAFAGLTLLATGSLLVLAPRTDTLFSWTVVPPLSAAFLGAGYGAGCVLSVLAYRSGSWAESRVPLVTVLVFTVLTLVATLAHLDRFHLAAPGAVARLAAWVWLAVYVVVPVALGVVVVRQGRVAGRGPATPGVLPRWLAALLGLQGAALVLVGSVLFAAPGVGATFWPWALTPLTARMTAAWLLALGLAALLALREPVRRRLRIPAVAYTVFGLLQLLGLLVYGEAVDWGSPAAAVYVGALVVVLLTGVAGLRLARGPAPEEGR